VVAEAVLEEEAGVAVEAVVVVVEVAAEAVVAEARGTG
jgi:hypothetical protein